MRKGLAKLLPAILARMCNNHFFIPCANPTPFCMYKIENATAK